MLFLPEACCPIQCNTHLNPTLNCRNWSEGDMGEVNTFERLRRLLECQICFNVLSVPVAVCRDNGHAVCTACSLFLKSCPFCKSLWSTGRHTLLSDIIHTVLPECRHCHKQQDAFLLAEHEESCSQMSVQCFIFNRYGSCPSRIYRNAFWNHVTKKHSTGTVLAITEGKLFYLPVRKVFHNKNFTVLFTMDHGVGRQQTQMILRIYGDLDERLLHVSLNSIQNRKNIGFAFFVFLDGCMKGQIFGNCLPISAVPQRANIHPEKHAGGGVAFPKTSKIFTDPDWEYYDLSLKVYLK
ncbi:UNVERIFIED_CONTAM: hypothetical protein PYX00_002307 [Menopon gallinae]|uniref:RING-type domain-containing protein n=1 Tax=Menopon gallinae TaxID=328185 RepID=A0AAW2IG90_9NEOP